MKHSKNTVYIGKLNNKPGGVRAEKENKQSNLITKSINNNNDMLNAHENRPNNLRFLRNQGEALEHCNDAVIMRR